MPVRDKQVSFHRKMTVGNKLDESMIHSSGPYYVRLQNIPSCAGQKHVRDFFSGLHIVSGGISFHGKGAFVVFYNKEDALAAVQMSRRRLLLGMVMRVSNVERREIRRSQLESAKRKLVMDRAMMQTAIPPIHTDQLQHRPSKRIRPTIVTNEIAKSLEIKFSPEEIEVQDINASQSTSQQLVPSTVSSYSRKQSLKTIKPTPVVSLKQYNFVFEQEVF